MIYLNKGFFKPTAIIFSVILAPITIACLIISILDFTMGRMLVSLAFIAVYTLLIIFVYLYSKRKDYYLLNDEELFIIKYPNVASNLEELKLKTEDILKIEYYKLSSLKAWCLLLSYISPGAVFITFRSGTKEECKLIGYPSFEEIEKLCADKGIAFESR